MEEESSKSSKEHYPSSLGSNTQYSDSNSNARISDNEIILSPPLSFSENTIITISSDSEEEGSDDANATQNSSFKSSLKDEIKSPSQIVKVNTSPGNNDLKNISDVSLDSIEYKGNKTSSEKLPIQELRNEEEKPSMSLSENGLCYETFPDTSGSHITISSVSSTKSFANLIFTKDNPHFTEEDNKILFGQLSENLNKEQVNIPLIEENNTLTSKNESNDISNDLIPFVRYLPAYDEPVSFRLIVERDELCLSSDYEEYSDDLQNEEIQLTNIEPLIINREKTVNISKNERKKKIKKNYSVSNKSNENNDESMVLRSGKKKPPVDEVEDQLVKLFKKISIKDNVDIEIPLKSYVTLPSGALKKLKASNISKVVQRVCKTGKKKQDKKQKNIIKKTLKKKIRREKLLIKNANTINIRSTATTTLYNFGRDCIQTFPRSEVRQPRARILCAMECGKPKAYTCTATGVPICSLQCYRKNIENQTKEIVQQFAADNYIHLIYLQRDTTRNLHLNIAMTPRNAENSLPSEEEQRTDELSSYSSS